MSENKTQKTTADVVEFLNSVENTRRREDGLAVLAMMKDVTGLEPKMWGPTMVGFGDYHYVYESGREGDTFMVGFSPRKQNLTLYIPDFEGYEALRQQLGKHKTGQVCLYINKLADVDQDVLRRIIDASYRHMQEIKAT